METKYPSYVRIDKTIYQKYLEPLKKSGLFDKSEGTEIYFISASLGFKLDLKKESEDRMDLRLYSQLLPKYQSLIRIIALKHCGLEDYSILEDGAKMLKIVESYANGGAPLLYDKIMKGNGMDFSIENEIWEELSKESDTTSLRTSNAS